MECARDLASPAEKLSTWYVRRGPSQQLAELDSVILATRLVGTDNLRTEAASVT
jgi:hypothetical protein